MIVHVLIIVFFARCVLQAAKDTKRSHYLVRRRLRLSAAPLARGLWAPARFRRGPCRTLGSGSLRSWPRWAQVSLAWGSAPCRAQARCSFPSGDSEHTRTLRRSEATSPARLFESQVEQEGLSPGCHPAPLGSSQNDKTSAITRDESLRDPRIHRLSAVKLIGEINGGFCFGSGQRSWEWVQYSHVW